MEGGCALSRYLPGGIAAVCKSIHCPQLFCMHQTIWPPNETAQIRREEKRETEMARRRIGGRRLKGRMKRGLQNEGTVR